MDRQVPPSKSRTFSAPFSHTNHSMRTRRIFLLLVFLESARVLSASTPPSQTISAESSPPTFACTIPQTTYSPGLQKRFEKYAEVKLHSVNQQSVPIIFGAMCASVLVLSLVPFYQSVLGTADGGLGWLFEKASWIGNQHLGNVSRLR